MTDYFAERIPLNARQEIINDSEVKFPSGTSTNPDAPITQPEGNEGPENVTGELKIMGFKATTDMNGTDICWSSQNKTGFESSYRETDDEDTYEPYM